MDTTLDPIYVDLDSNDNTPDDSDTPPAPSAWPPVTFLDLDDLPF